MPQQQSGLCIMDQEAEEENKGEMRQGMPAAVAGEREGRKRALGGQFSHSSS